MPKVDRRAEGSGGYRYQRAGGRRITGGGRR